MAHTGSCEGAKGHTCKCPCGNARHGGTLITGISSLDTADQDRALDLARPRRWADLTPAQQQPNASTAPDRRVGLDGVVNEVIVKIIEGMQDNLTKTGELNAVGALATGISQEIGDAFEAHLVGGSPVAKGNRHLWCVVLASICKAYDKTVDFARQTLDELVELVMGTLEEPTATDLQQPVHVRDIYRRTTPIAEAFTTTAYSWLKILVKHALGEIITAIAAIGEVAVIAHIRLFGAIVCPDPDQHPAVVKYCIWPLLSGPFKHLLEKLLASQMQQWIKNSYAYI